jgi:hypothetical protein
VAGVDLLAGVGIPPVLLRVLPTGNAGSATVGGPIEGREGRGKEFDMALSVSDGLKPVLVVVNARRSLELKNG